MKKVSFSCLGVSLLFSLFFVFGYSMHHYQTIFILLKSGSNFLKASLCFLLLTVLFYFLCSFLFQKMNHEKEIHSKLYSFLFVKHPLLAPFCCFLFLGIPILVIFYPGPVQWDALRQLDYYSGVLHWSNHHPIFSSFLMGVIQQFGSFLINDNFGVFLYNFLQFLLLSFAFASIFYFFNQWHTPGFVRILSFLFLAFNPVWYLYGYTLMKDSLYFILFIFFFLCYIEFYYHEKRKIPLLITSILLILMRNNGIYVVLLSFLIFLFKKNLRKWAFICIGSFLFVFFLLSFIINHCDIYKGNVREMLSIPIQQTARFITYREVSGKDREILESVFHHELDEIKEKYNPEISDPVKFMFQVNNNQELISYFKVWLHGLIKRPDIYIDGFLHHTYGYFYPFKKEVKDGIAYFDIEQNKRVNKGNFDIYMLNSFKLSRSFIENSISWIRQLPGIEFIYNTGTYFFVLLTFTFYALYKGRKEKIILSIPLYITYLFCLLSPVNAYLRYMYPIIFALPVYFGLVTSSKHL